MDTQPGPCTFASIRFSFLTQKWKTENAVSSLMVQTLMNRISRHKQIFIIQNSDFFKNHKNDMKFVF